MSDRTFVDTLLRQARERPQAEAYSSVDARLTFADVEVLTNRIANALVALGIARGHRVACLTKHHIECLLLTLAACKIGAVCMPVNWRLAASEIEYIINHGEARFLMLDSAFVPVLQRARFPQIKQMVCTERAIDELPSFKRWYEDADERLTPVVADSDAAALQLYSSGTTGLPKGVVLTHRGLLSSCSVIAHDWCFDSGCVVGNPLPTFHVAGMNMLLLPLYAGGRAAVYPEFDQEAFIGNIAQHGITHSFLVPAMLLFMLQVPLAEQGDYRTLKLIAYGGSPISERVLRDALRVFKCRFLQVYGLTEVSGPATFLYPGDHEVGVAHAERLRSAGRAIAGTRIRIVEPATLHDVPEGDVGEVWIESDRNLKEYWRNPEATAAVYPEGRNERGGWFRTGDAGYLKDGYLYIHDRVKDMIISGGENIYPAEVENVLMRHPAVADGAVIGVPDEKWGEAVKACVVVRPGSQAGEQEIIEFMREHLAHYKCPKSVDFCSVLPRNPSGKLLKRVLREPYWRDRVRQVG